MNRAVLAIGCIALMAACQQSTPPAAHQAVTPSALSTGSNRLVDLPLNAADFSCRLPVTIRSGGGDYIFYQGGFVTFPRATFEKDQAGYIDVGSVKADFFNFNMAMPWLRGIPEAGPPIYDLARKLWVPVGADQAAPDGASYAYGSLPGQVPPDLELHVVNVVRATEADFDVDPSPDYGATIGALVDDFDGSSVYFSSAQTRGPALGVWRLDVATESPTKLSSAVGVAAVRGGYAWVNRIDPRDPVGAQLPWGTYRSNSLVRIELATGQETVWYFAPGHQVLMMGFDRDGHPIVGDASAAKNVGDPDVVLLFSPQLGATIYHRGRGLSFNSIQPDRQGRL